MARLPVIIIHLGSPVPSFVRTSVAQVRRVSDEAPILIGPVRGARLSSASLDRFRRIERLSSMGLTGFWRYACERFFVLEEAMRRARIDRCLHIESDNLLYVAPSELDAWLGQVYAAGIAQCPLTNDEDTASVLYAGSLSALSRFNAALLDLVALRQDELLRVYGGAMGHEMRMINILRVEQGLAGALPTTADRAKELNSRYIFDPASYGQQVDGISAKPGVPYAGDHHVVGREILNGNYRVLWDAQQLRPLVQVADGTEEYRLANLHIHSKRLGRWATESNPVPGGVRRPVTHRAVGLGVEIVRAVSRRVKR